MSNEEIEKKTWEMSLHSCVSIPSVRSFRTPEPSRKKITAYHSAPRPQSMCERDRDWIESWKAVHHQEKEGNNSRPWKESDNLYRHPGYGVLTPIQALRLLYGTDTSSPTSPNRNKGHEKEKLCHSVPAFGQENRSQDMLSPGRAQQQMQSPAARSARRSLGGELQQAAEPGKNSPLTARILQEISNMKLVAAPCPEKMAQKTEKAGLTEQTEALVDADESQSKVHETPAPSHTEDSVDLECLSLSDSTFSTDPKATHSSAKDDQNEILPQRRLLLVKGNVMCRLAYLLLGFLVVLGSILSLFPPSKPSFALVYKSYNFQPLNLPSGSEQAPQMHTTKELGQESSLQLKAKSLKNVATQVAQSTSSLQAFNSDQPLIQGNTQLGMPLPPFPCFEAGYKTLGAGFEVDGTISWGTWVAALGVSMVGGWFYLRYGTRGTLALGRYSRKSRYHRNADIDFGRAITSHHRGHRSEEALQEDMYPDVIPDTGTYSVLRKSVVNDHVTVTPLRRSARLTPAAHCYMSRYSLADAFDEACTPPSYLAYDFENSAANTGKTPRRSLRIAHRNHQVEHFTS